MKLEVVLQRIVSEVLSIFIFIFLLPSLLAARHSIVDTISFECSCIAFRFILSAVRNEKEGGVAASALAGVLPNIDSAF